MALPDDDGVTALFKVVMTHMPSAYFIGPNTICNEALQPGEVLLVQLINSSEE